MYVVLWLVLILFVYKLVLKPLKRFSDAVADGVDIDLRNDLKGLREIHEGVDRLSDVSLAQKPAIRSRSGANQRCDSTGLYLGSRDIPVDCATLCASPDYNYKFVAAEDSVILNYKFVSKSGGYCLPNEKVLHCNTYTSRLIKTINDWKCLPKNKLFGGEDGCRVVGCNGFVKDNLTGVYYSGRVPLTLALSDPDTETVAHEHVYGTPGPGLYRFQCTDTEIDPRTGEPTAMAKKCTVKDFMNNDLVASEYSRFDRIRNMCASLIYNAPSAIVPNFRDGTCTCLAGLHSARGRHAGSDIAVRRFVDGLEVSDVGSRCSPCLSGWSEKERFTNVGVPCRKAFDNGPIDARKVIIPCGIKRFDSNTAACINVNVHVSRGLSSFAKRIFDEKK